MRTFFSPAHVRSETQPTHSRLHHDKAGPLPTETALDPLNSPPGSIAQGIRESIETAFGKAQDNLPYPDRPPARLAKPAS